MENRILFDGPVFLVGRPRSGTKLLRELLNRHPKISIPFWESNFIPYLSGRALSFGNLRNFQNFEDFFSFFSKVEFFRMIKKENKYTHIVDDKVWYGAIKEYSYAGAIEAFYMLYAKCDGKSMWGDKSPHYMLYTPYLKNQFPKSKYIHIIRDIRDNCLSNMKAWNKNPYRSAQLWVNDIACFRRDAKLYLKGDYLEVKYEDLLSDPDLELMRVCNYLGIKYDPCMLLLDVPVENLGAAKGKTEIVKGNAGKWVNWMDKSMVKEIETIGYDLMQEIGYPVRYAVHQKSMSKYKFRILRYSDAWNRLLFDCASQGGWLRGLTYQYKKRTKG